MAYLTIHRICHMAPNTQPYEIPNISVDNPCQDLSTSMIVLSKLEKLEKLEKMHLLVSH